MLIREPLPADAPALGRCHAQAWQTAYRGQMPDELLDAVTVERRTAMWRRVLDSERGELESIVVADVDGVAAGFAWTGPCRDADGPDGAGELFAINVGPDSWGAGVGSALITAAHDALTTAEFELAVLWVLPGNVRARGFYERHGWAADGLTRDEVSDGFTISEVRYTRRFER